jgi:predicted amidophosphoribosyltransferase
MARVARAIGADVDVREALVTAHAREAAHAQQNHRDPDALRATLATVANKLARPPALAILLDDVLTTGCSFTVCKAILTEVWPATSFLGLFAARRVIDRTLDFDDLDLEL